MVCSIFQNELEAYALGAGGRRFESCHLDSSITKGTPTITVGVFYLSEKLSYVFFI